LTFFNFRGTEGSKTFNATRVLADGDAARYGIKVVGVPSTYYWKNVG